MKNHNEQSGQNGPDCAAATHNTQAKDSEIKSRAYPFVEGYALFFATALKMQHTEHLDPAEDDLRTIEVHKVICDTAESPYG